MSVLSKISIGQNSVLDVIVVSTVAARSRGLLDIKKLKKNSGMLFKFPSLESGVVVTTFGMNFHIDILCFDKNLLVNDIISNVAIDKLVYLQKPILYFLEINCGESYKISIGDKLTFI